MRLWLILREGFIVLGVLSPNDAIDKKTKEDFKKKVYNFY